MLFRIADTFTDSLAQLTADEQRAAKTTAFDLQLDPTSPGMSFHKLDRARDKNFWSVRVNADIRLIVHKTTDSLLLCYVDHHDKAYDWAERRKLEAHPTTGAAQLVEIRETVQEILVPTYITAAAPQVAAREERQPQAARLLTPLLANVPEDELLSYGVPPEWLSEVRRATEDRLLVLATRLPAEAGEALLELAVGGKPRPLHTVGASADPFDHPDAQRRFRIMTNVEELARALEYPWDKWTIFLHPEQRQWVERDQNGPARVSGSAGTGKTIVALHRAVHLANAHPDSRVLLTTFSDILANDLRARLYRLIHNRPQLGERIEVYSIDTVGARLYKAHFGGPKLATHDVIKDLLSEAASAAPVHKFTDHFLRTEWEHVVDAWQLQSWEGYRDVARLGRRTRLPEPQRALLWAIFEKMISGLATRGIVTQSQMFHRLAVTLQGVKNPPFDFAVVDEAQDIGVAHLRFLSALGAHRHDALFFAGDLGQRIFQQPFSWKSLGVDIRGRSRTLRVNYRTSHQIRTQADRLLGKQVSDIDGNTEDRADTISVFNGPPPNVAVFQTPEEETAAVMAWISERLQEGLAPHELAVFVRSPEQYGRALGAIHGAGAAAKTLGNEVETAIGSVSVSTMHLAKGLEFRAVAVMACDDEVIPLQGRIETVGDDADLREVYDTERHLLYVACTRARDQLLVTGVAPASEFLADLAAQL